MTPTIRGSGSSVRTRACISKEAWDNIVSD
nr:hypothetical protein [Muricauda sp. F6463D]